MKFQRPMLDLWRFAHNAYFPDKLIALPHTSLMNEGDDFGYITCLPDKVIVSFQGTGTLIKGDAMGKVRDWVSNLSAFPATTELKKNGLLIHHGFYEGWRPFKQHIDSIIGQPAQRDKDWYVTGHSRGGALAALCARHIAKNRDKPCSCITYAAPAQGGKEYRNELNTLPIDLTNIVHGYDIGPEMPHRALGYRHAGKTYWWKEPWWHRFTHKIRDHLPKNYNKWVKKNYGVGYAT